MVVMDWLKKVTDIIMPPVDTEEEFNEGKVEAKPEQQVNSQQVNTQQTQAKNLVETMATRRAMAGGGVSNVSAMPVMSTTASVSRPNLKLIKPPEFIMKVYQPSDYSQIKNVSDDILAHKATVVNYESVPSDDQRRICDYIDGLCYAVDGTVTQISEKIYLYVPAGIRTSDISALVASVRHH